MSEHNELVEKQRLLLKAEEWAKGVKSLHAHKLNSMGYDDRPQDTETGSGVLDIEYNSGLITREILDTGEMVEFGTVLKGEDLIQAFNQST